MISKNKRKKINITAVILAGGGGKRMGGVFKQFLKIRNKPVLFYSLEKFIKNKLISEIIVVVPKQKLQYARRLIKKRFGDGRISIVSCLKTRKQSIYNVLSNLNKNRYPPEYVVFHDAARPAIPESAISLVCRKAARCGGAVVVGKTADLILEAETGGHIRRAIPKETTYHGYTPQCFRFKDIYGAHKKAENKEKFDSSDNIELMGRFNRNVRIRLIEAAHPIHKITFPEDLIIVKKFL